MWLFCWSLLKIQIILKYWLTNVIMQISGLLVLTSVSKVSKQSGNFEICGRIWKLLFHLSCLNIQKIENQEILYTQLYLMSLSQTLNELYNAQDPTQKEQVLIQRHFCQLDRSWLLLTCFQPHNTITTTFNFQLVEKQTSMHKYKLAKTDFTRLKANFARIIRINVQISYVCCILPM